MLDADTGLEIAWVLKRLSRDRGMALLVISHQLEIISRLCGAVCVLHDGRIVERISIPDAWDAARNPYACELTRAMKFFICS